MLQVSPSNAMDRMLASSVSLKITVVAFKHKTIIAVSRKHHRNQKVKKKTGTTWPPQQTRAGKTRDLTSPFSNANLKENVVFIVQFSLA